MKRNKNLPTCRDSIIKREYQCWSDAKTRCYCKTNKFYNSYGGRGITMCDRWKNSFENFYKDMGPRPSNKHSLDRIDNNGNYEPSNCRWATKGEQAWNVRSHSHRKGVKTTSKYVGVRKSHGGNKYCALICTKGKQKYLGIFKTEVEAAIAYNNAALNLRGKNARINKIEGGKEK